jgi:adenylate cyclase
MGLVASLAALDGAAVVAFYLLIALPVPIGVDRAHWEDVNLIVFAAYMPASLVVGSTWSYRWLRPVSQWLDAGGTPTATERRLALSIPRVEVTISAVMWLGAALLFAVVNLRYSAQAAGLTAAAIVLGGMSTSALIYLVTERVSRPVLAGALLSGSPGARPCGGIGRRMVLTWAFCTGVPVLGIGLELVHRNAADLRHLVFPTVFLVVVALGAGLVGTVLVSRAASERLGGIRRALDEVAHGRLDVEVPVDDAGELGEVEAGVNRMVSGLRERQLLQDLFGRHVGEQVAQRAMERGVDLGGELIDAAMLFVDVDGSTRLAATHPPGEVVALLNRFFAQVVEVVNRHDGWVNKFEGDAALCVFGVPTASATAVTCALRAARELHEALAGISGLGASIGVAAGPVVAGNVGAPSRYEYTVIGDPVNTAARLTELAKTHPGRLLADADLLEHADADEAAHWTAAGVTMLRGRNEVTALAGCRPPVGDGRLIPVA